MATPQATSEHYARQAALTAATVAAMRRAWQAMTPEFDASWATVGPRLLTLLAAAQLGAARAARIYVPAVLDELGLSAPAVGEIDPRAFVGTASDGRPLDSLLFQSVVQAKAAVGAGSAPAQALGKARNFLDLVAQTQVADAQRAAAATAVAVRPGITGYVRMLVPPGDCSRCVVLAGAWYRWNAGFERHPRCNCVHVPATEDVGDDFRTSPDRYFHSLTEAEQDRVFTKEGAEAIRLGADLIQVVNARRGMSTAQTPSGRRIAQRDARGLLTTTEGTTRRGVANRARTGRNARVRLMPESIMQIADGDREEAIRLLRLNGFIHPY